MVVVLPVALRLEAKREFGERFHAAIPKLPPQL
jgi:hypothetical protein